MVAVMAVMAVMTVVAVVAVVAVVMAAAMVMAAKQYLDLRLVVLHERVRPLSQKLLHFLRIHLRVADGARALAIRVERSVVVEVVSTKHGVFEPQLLAGPLEHLAFERVTSHQAVNVDLPLLADTVASCHGLHVVLRVPVAVEKDACVGRGEVDTDASRAGRK